MFSYLYEITNTVNGKIYVGVHKTQDLDDGYMGSGKIIRSAIAKHGFANFTKVINESEVLIDLHSDLQNHRSGSVTLRIRHTTG